MYTATKRRLREAEKRVERLHYKFITEYMKSLHKDIFDKAEELYKNTRLLYPDGVKDLTKTIEFMQTVTPNKTIPRYYACRKTNETHIRASNGREMVLEIPLMPQSETTSPPVAAPPPPAVSQPLLLPADVYEELLQDLQKDPDLRQILNDFPLDDMQELSNDLPHDDMQELLNDFPLDDMVELSNDYITPLEKELQQFY